MALHTEFTAKVSESFNICRLQDKGAVQGRSGSRQHVVAHHRGAKEARLARDGIREHKAFSDHEMRGPPGTGRGGVLMAGGRQGAGNGKGRRSRRMLSPPCFWFKNSEVFLLFLSQ